MRIVEGKKALFVIGVSLSSFPFVSQCRFAKPGPKVSRLLNRFFIIAEVHRQAADVPGFQRGCPLADVFRCQNLHSLIGGAGDRGEGHPVQAITPEERIKPLDKQMAHCGRPPEVNGIGDEHAVGTSNLLMQLAIAPHRIALGAIVFRIADAVEATSARLELVVPEMNDFSVHPFDTSYALYRRIQQSCCVAFFAPTTKYR
jgi:hypothetical protein